VEAGLLQGRRAVPGPTERVERGALQSFTVFAQERALIPTILSSSLWCSTCPSYTVMKTTSLNSFKGNPLLTASAGECECG